MQFVEQWFHQLAGCSLFRIACSVFFLSFVNFILFDEKKLRISYAVGNILSMLSSYATYCFTVHYFLATCINGLMTTVML